MKEAIGWFGGLFMAVFCLTLVLSLPAAWITHIVECLSDDRWGFLIAGAIFFPIAIIHGFMIWLGVA